MATWAVGDIHGRRATLEALIDRLDFDQAHDHLWLVGDLVNRGPDSLGVLRWAQRQAAQLKNRFVCVLGNHDLHLLAAEAGLRSAGKDLQPILEASDCAALIRWLRERPLVHRRGRQLLVHAGLWPEWTADDAESWARRLESVLRQGDTSLLKSKSFEPADREQQALARALYGFTSLRLLDNAGKPCSFKGPPSSAPDGCRPWFSATDRRWLNLEVICGHWAALGRHLEPHVCALDSGAAWDRELTALRLEDRMIVSQLNLDVR